LAYTDIDSLALQKHKQKQAKSQMMTNLGGGERGESSRTFYIKQVKSNME